MIALAGPLVGMRRYRCADCGWTGWKHRLRRRSSANEVSLLQREAPESRALWFGIGVLTFIVITTVLLLRSCEPAERPDITAHLRGAPYTNGIWQRHLTVALDKSGS
jgi:hypothetical protein